MAFTFDQTRTTSALARMPASANKTTLVTAANTFGAAMASACTNASTGVQSPGYLECEDVFVRCLTRIADELNDQT